MTGKVQLVDALELVLSRILTAAIDGQGGSATYAMDRLRLIQELAEIGLKKPTR